VGLPLAKKIVKLKVSKACFLFLLRGLRLDPKGISVKWTTPFMLKRVKMKDRNNMLELDTEPAEEICSVSVAVSTSDFLSGITGSNPVPSTKY
jgi:hypothetical protein